MKLRNRAVLMVSGLAAALSRPGAGVIALGNSAEAGTPGESTEQAIARLTAENEALRKSKSDNGKLDAEVKAKMSTGFFTPEQAAGIVARQKAYDLQIAPVREQEESARRSGLGPR